MYRPVRLSAGLGGNPQHISNSEFGQERTFRQHCALRLSSANFSAVAGGRRFTSPPMHLARPCFSMRCIIDKQNRTCYTQQIGPSKAMSYPIVSKKLHVSRGNT